MRFITCRLPDGVEDPAILSADGRQVWPLSWLGLSYETLSDAIPFLTPQVRAGLSLAIAGIPALPIEAVTPESPIPLLLPNIRTPSTFPSGSPGPCRTAASSRPIPTS